MRPLYKNHFDPWQLDQETCYSCIPQDMVLRDILDLEEETTIRGLILGDFFDVEEDDARKELFAYRKLSL